MPSRLRLFEAANDEHNAIGCAYLGRRQPVEVPNVVPLSEPDPVGGAVDLTTLGTINPERLSGPVGMLTGATVSRLNDAVRAPHGKRHTYKTMMERLRTPAPLMDNQMGHADGSVQARYSHFTQEMIDDLMAGLTVMWTQALDERRALSPRSAVPPLDRLLATGDPK